LHLRNRGSLTEAATHHDAARWPIAPLHPHEPNMAAPPSPHDGLERIGLTVDDINAAVEELRAKGAEIAVGPLTRNPGLRPKSHAQ